jgi:L-galactose dehydrogenase
MTTTYPPTYVEGFHDEDSIAKMKYRELGNTGMKVSILSFGASSLGSVFRKTNLEESKQVVNLALRSGINLIDTAPWYGHGKSETVLGKCLQGIPRQAYYLNTKVGRYLPNVEQTFDFSAERTIQSVKESLERMGVEYLDCVQVHDPEFSPSLDIILKETLPALQACKDAGLIKFIGITGYPLDAQLYLLQNTTIKIDTSLTYCHYSLNDTTLMDTFLPYLQDNGIGCINASPISMGLLSDRGPPEWHPASKRIKITCAEAASYCKEKGVDISRIAMCFTLANERLPTTLVSTASVVRMQSNIEAVYTPLTSKEKEAMDYVLSNIFSRLKGEETWSGLEVAEYWKLRKENWLSLASAQKKE